MSKMLIAATVSGIALLPFAALAHTGDTEVTLEGFATSKSYIIFSEHQVDGPEELIQIPDGFGGVGYNLANSNNSLPGEHMIEYDCACAGGAMGAAAGGLAGGAFGFFGTYGNPIGGMVGGAIGAAIGEGLHQGYHDMQDDHGVQNIEPRGTTAPTD